MRASAVEAPSSLSWVNRANRLRWTAASVGSLIVSIAVIVAAIFLIVPGARAGSPAAALVTPGEMRSGALLLESTEQGRYVEAPRLGTDVALTVSGPTARARVTQIFQNPTDGWIEAVYVYPLP